MTSFLIAAFFLLVLAGLAVTVLGVGAGAGAAAFLAARLTFTGAAVRLLGVAGGDFFRAGVVVLMGSP